MTPGDLLRDAENILGSWSAPGWQKKLQLFIREWLSDDTHMDVLTSGSTGAPKTIRVAKEQMVGSARRTGKFLGLRRGEKALLCLPVDYIAGKMMVVRAFVLGLDLVTVYPSSNPMESLVPPPDFVALTPMQLHHVLDADGGAQWLGSIRNVIIGGAGMDAHQEMRLKHLPNCIHHTYGMTETLTHVAMRKVNGPDREGHYRALEGVTFGTDHRGCLLITDRLLGIDGLATNDQVSLVSVNAFRYLGRIDHVINTGGVKVNPEVVEGKLQAHLDNRVVLAGRPDPVLGEKVVLVVELGGRRKPENLRAVLDTAGLERFERPREVFFTEFFPESSAGKIGRKKIMEWIADQEGEPVNDPG